MKRILYFVTEDWTFCGIRMSLAEKAKEQGYDVIVVTRVNEHRDIIVKAGFTLVPIEISRAGLNPFKDIKLIFKLIRIFRQYKPDIVHNISMKPVLYGTLVSRLMGIKNIVNLLNGMGVMFSENSGNGMLRLQKLVKFCFKILLKNKSVKVVVQNSEDLKLLTDEVGIPKYSVKLIKGSGVNPNEFYPVDEVVGTVNITYVGRLLWEKGVGLLVESARLLKEKGINFKVTLVGSIDNENPTSINQAQIDSWVAEGIVEFLGHRTDIRNIWNQAHIAVLPTSYREGLPRSLLEAASCGKPIISSDNAGCLEIVHHNVNGLIVQNKSVSQLTDYLEELINNKRLRLKFGGEGRKMILESFSDEIVIKETMLLYKL